MSMSQKRKVKELEEKLDELMDYLDFHPHSHSHDDLSGPSGRD